MTATVRQDQAVSREEQARTYIDLVLPKEKAGEGFFISKGPSHAHPKFVWRDQFFRSIDDAIKESFNQSDQGYNSYIAMGRFTGDGVISRKADRATSFKSFFLDIDIKPEGNNYRDAKTAFEALERFTDQTGLPYPTLIIRSGSGAHIYWAFDEEVSADDWGSSAEKLKALHTRHGFLADGSVTADRARVLRLPGTCNRKKETPIRVEIKHIGGSFDFETLKNIIDEAYEKLGSDNKGSTPSSTVIGPSNNVIFLNVKPEHITTRKSTARDIVDPDDAETPENIDRVRIALFSLSADCPRGEWMTHILAIASLGWECGLDLADEWSKTAPARYEGKESVRKLYDSYDPTKPGKITLGSLIQKAKENGWIDPRTVKAPVQISADSVSVAGAGDGGDDRPWLDHVNDKYAFIRNKGIYSAESRCFVSDQTFKTQFSNELIPVEGEDKKLKFIRKGEAWLTHRDRATCEGLKFAPGEARITQDGYFNTYNGFAVKPEEGNIDLFNLLLRSMFPDYSERLFVTQWMAHKVRHPGVKMSIALIVWGSTEGTGKNTLFEKILGGIFGDHAKTLSNTDLASDFNSWVSNTCLAIVSEAHSSANRTNNNRLKQYTGDSKISVTFKGKDTLMMQNVIDFVLLSNEPDAAALGPNDRRFAVFETKTALDESFSKKLYMWLEDKGLSNVLYYLLNVVDMSGFNPKGTAPMTEAKMDCIESAKSDFEIHLLDALRNDPKYFGMAFTVAALINMYKSRTGVLLSGVAASRKLKSVKGVMRKRVRTHPSSNINKLELIAFTGLTENSSPDDWRNGYEKSVEAFLT